VFCIPTVQVGSILRPKFEAASLPSISEAQRKKQNFGGMDVNNNRFLNTIPRRKFGLSAGIQKTVPLHHTVMQISCKILPVAKDIL
jgi:hypothetical protein